MCYNVSTILISRLIENPELKTIAYKKIGIHRYVGTN